MLPATRRGRPARIKASLDLRGRTVLEVLHADSPRFDESEMPRPRSVGPNQARTMAKKARLRTIGNVVAWQIVRAHRWWRGFIGGGEALEIGSREVILKMRRPHHVVGGGNAREKRTWIVDIKF